MRKLAGYHPGARRWRSANSISLASVSLEESASTSMKTKSVETEMNALTQTVTRDTPGNADTSYSLDTASSRIPVPTVTW